MLKYGETRYNYDSFNRLKRVETFDGQIQINRYDGEGLRHEIEENGALIQFIYSGKDVIVETGAESHLTRYIRGYELISADSEKARTYYHYCNDELGSITHILDEEGSVLNRYEYDAFGNTLLCEETVPNRFRFTGQQYDSITEQYYLRARYYNPVIGRFIQEDTYYGDGLNLYAYCENNPIRYIDPSGYTKVDAFEKRSGDQQALYEIVDEVNNKGGASIEEKDIIYQWADEYGVDRDKLGLKDQLLLEDKSLNKGGSQAGSYAPDRELPRTKHGDPIPDTDVPHTQLGKRDDGYGPYNQARTWEQNPNGKGITATEDIDFSDHRSPDIHPNPHKHKLTPNNPKTAPKGGYKRGRAEPFEY